MSFLDDSVATWTNPMILGTESTRGTYTSSRVKPRARPTTARRRGDSAPVDCFPVSSKTTGNADRKRTGLRCLTLFFTGRRPGQGPEIHLLLGAR